MTREPSKVYEYRPIEYEFSCPSHSYFENLAIYVPPRLPIEKPDMHVLTPDSVTLTWKPARVPKSIQHTSELSYTIEVRTPPSFEWRELVSGLNCLTHTLKDLHPRVDYMFRIRAWNKYGCSEPSLPVSLYRPIQLDEHESYQDEDEQWEQQWEIRFGERVPPRLPMETPRLTDVGPESLLLTWLPARIPAYAKRVPISYSIEMKEPPITGWKRLISNLSDTQHFVQGLTPSQDYSFRVRAETEYGISDPTLPAVISRRKGSGISSPVMPRRPSLEKKEDDLSLPTLSYIDTITAGVPPRVPTGRPSVTNMHADKLTLTWMAARVPSYVKGSTIKYTIEAREPPSNIWTVLAKDIPFTSYEVSDLRQDQDYMFRVKAENQYGKSEPTLPVSVFRENDETYVPEVRSRSASQDTGSPWMFRKRSASTELSRDSDSPLDTRTLRSKPSLAPEFVTAEDEVQYGVGTRPVKIHIHVKGSPQPTVQWFFKGDKLEEGGRYTSNVHPDGAVTLEFPNMTWDDIGDYKCSAENENGVAVRIVPLDMADPPTFMEPLKDLVLVSREGGKLECRVDGVPYPTVKWTKDFRPLTETTRMTSHHEPPDYWSLTFNGAIMMDSGQYACVAENVSGKAMSIAKVTVEEKLPSRSDLTFKQAPIEDHYHILEEIGRGRHGIVRRVIEKSTGHEFAAKFIRVRDQPQKDFFHHELEAMRVLNHKNIQNICDAYETDRRLVLVSELATGGELLDNIIKEDRWSESEAAYFVKQLLDSLAHIHSKGVLHLDLKPSNILLGQPDSEEIKLIDFGQSRRMKSGTDLRHNYGTPEFASPEQVDNDPLSTSADAWGVGVITYILLSGLSPFHGESDKDTLTRVQICDWDFDKDVFENVSSDAKDFISKLLIREPSERLTIGECLKHPWIKMAIKRGQGLKLNLDRLNTFHSRDKWQRMSGAVRTIANLRSLKGLLKGLSSEVPVLQPQMDDKGHLFFPDSEAYGEFLDDEDYYDWQTRYQSGLDTTLMPLEDTDYALRVRGYRRTAGEGADEEYAGEEGTPSRTMQERLLVSDVAKEFLSPSLEKEFEWLAASEEFKKQRKSKDTDAQKIADRGLLPIFKDKIQDQAYNVGEDVTFRCNVIGAAPISVSWFRNEEMISDGNRIRTSYSEGGEASVTIVSAKPYDAGVYKCVARNQDGRSTCRARLLLGDSPDRPGRPVVTMVSSEQAFLIWDAPTCIGNSPIVAYKIDFRKTADERWTTTAYTLDECTLVWGLKPDSAYRFRVSCLNRFGISPYSWSSVEVRTRKAGSPALKLDQDLEAILLRSRKAEQHPSPPPSAEGSRRQSVDLDTEEAQFHQSSPDESYTFSESIWRGKYADIKNCVNTRTGDICVAKVVPYSSDKRDEVLREFSVMRTLRQKHIVKILESFLCGDTFYIIFEKLYGENVVRFLSFKNKYSEDVVAHIMRQTLDAVQYLHHLGIMHLNLQPSSLVMLSRRRIHLKLVDFRLSRKLKGPDSELVPRAGYPDFMAPEVVAQEKTGLAADIWSLGVIAFLLLSGESPFAGDTDDRTLANIAYNRYDAGDLYENVTKEALKFIFRIFKRIPRNRMTVEECLEDKWLQLTDSVVRAQEKAVFLTNKLKIFANLYDIKRLSEDYTREFDLFSLPSPKVSIATSEPQKQEQTSISKEPVTEEETSEPSAAPPVDMSDDTKEASQEAIQLVAEDVVSKAIDDALHSPGVSGTE